MDKKAGFDNTHGWRPMGIFRGIFNGNTHKITDVWIDDLLLLI
jgi:hypothetical protein